MADNVVSVTFNGIDNLSQKTNSIAGSFTELNSMVSLAKQGIAFDSFLHAPFDFGFDSGFFCVCTARLLSDS